MNRLYLTLAAVAVVAIVAYAQIVSAPAPPGIGTQYSIVETNPALVPATDTDVATNTIYVEAITLTNITGSAVTCSILDKQSTPRAFLKDAALAANSAWVVPLPAGGRKFPSGVSWSCSSGTAVVGYMRGWVR